MRNRLTITPDRKTVNELLEKLEEYVSGMEELQYDLADSVECYMEETEDFYAEADSYLETAADERDLNRMLCRELSAVRRELASVLDCLDSHGLCPPAGRYLHYSRIDPVLYYQDPESPFYIQDPEEYLNSLLAIQLEKLRLFEKETPMTTSEREALREYIVRETGLENNDTLEWGQFLRNLREHTKTSEAAGKGW